MKKQCYEKLKNFIFAALFSLNITEGIHLDKRSEESESSKKDESGDRYIEIAIWLLSYNLYLVDIIINIIK